MKSEGRVASIFLSPAASSTGTLIRQRSANDRRVNEYKQMQYKAKSEKRQINAADEMPQKSGGEVDHVQRGISQKVGFELG